MDAESYFEAITLALEFALRETYILTSVQEEAVKDMVQAIKDGRVTITSKAK